MSMFAASVSRFMAWWHSRQHRERVMLAVMAIALAVFAWWLAAWSLQRVVTAADARLQHSTTELARIEASLRDIQRLRDRQTTSLAGKQLSQVILESATASRVPISRQRQDVGGMLVLGIDGVDTQALLAWLDALHRQHAIAPQRLAISEHNGQLKVEVAFRAVAP